MIRIKNLKKRFDGNVVFDGFSLELPDRGAYALAGPSGSGKTTLLRIISGLDADLEGEVVCDGTISYVFQENRLIPGLTAYENVFIVCRDRELSLSLLRGVGLADDADKRPAEMSGGMARRTAIARALAFPHDILLLDEPFTALDGGIKQKVTELINERERDKLLLAVTHDPNEASALGCKVIDITQKAEAAEE